MGEVINLGVATKMDLPTERVIDAAASANLSEVVIIGRDKDGNEYFASSIADGADVIWLAERMKLLLLTGEFS